MNEKDIYKIPTYISILSGTLSGILHVIIGYPFDTLKTLKQGNNTYKIQLNHFKDIPRLFKGITYPLIQNSLINASTFGLNNYLKNTVDNKYVSNLYTGILSTFILAPLDKYKIMSQYNKPYTVNLKNIISSYKRLHIISAREVPATFIYFSTYHYMRDQHIPIFLSGSIAGASSWFFTYPIDTIKTRIQNESCQTIKQAYRKGNLYSGVGVCLIRSFIVNGVNFSCYEHMNTYFMKKYINNNV